jgi:hypothetical protein
LLGRFDALPSEPLDRTGKDLGDASSRNQGDQAMHAELRSFFDDRSLAFSLGHGHGHNQRNRSHRWLESALFHPAGDSPAIGLDDPATVGVARSVKNFQFIARSKPQHAGRMGGFLGRQVEFRKFDYGTKLFRRNMESMQLK